MNQTAAPTSPPELVIEAGRADAHYWADLWRYRELLGFLAWRDIKVRYKQAALGIAWVVIQPAVQTLLLTFVFSKLAKMPKNSDVPYALIVLAGLIPWQLFSSAFNGAGSSVVGNAHLISKVYFPRLIVPLAAVAVALIDAAILLGISAPLAWLGGVMPTWHLCVLPLFVVWTLVIALGAGLWITALTVKYRDFRFITPFLLQIGMFVTPVGFRTEFLPNWRELLALNPLTGIVDGFRWCLLGEDFAVEATSLTTSVVVGLILFGTGLWFFRKTERQFADVI